MNNLAQNFVQDVVQKCTYPQLDVNDTFDIIVYSNSGKRLLIDGSDIEKYYNGYIMSNHQSREDALKRASIYVDKIANQWNSKQTRQELRKAKKIS